MLQAATISFLKQLKANNHKVWFDEHRKLYEAAKLDFENFTASVLKETAAFDATVAHLEARQCTFRINRDVRFSKNKDPYKTNLALHITAGGKKVINAGYYFHLEPGAAFLACGIWMPMPPDLKKIRQEIDYNFPAFHKIVGSKKSIKEVLRRSSDEIIATNLLFLISGSEPRGLPKVILFELLNSIWEGDKIFFFSLVINFGSCL